MKTNYDKLAIGLLEVMNKRGELGIMSIGMIPKETFDWFMKLMFEEMAKKLTIPGAEYEYYTWETLVVLFTDKFKQSIEHKMSVALYRNAKMVV